MSDETTNYGGKKKPERDKVVLEAPQAKDQELFEFLEQLFYAEPEVAHFPERIEIQVVSGSRQEKIGPQVKQYTFAPVKASDEAIKAGAGRKKPTREELVVLSNQMRSVMQRDCDEGRRAKTFGILVYQYGLSDGYHERLLRHFTPKATYVKDGEEDEDSIEKKFSGQILGHQERMFALFGGAFEGMLERLDHFLERAYDRIEKQDAVIQKKDELMEKALSLEAERQERREWTKFKIKGAEKGLEMVLALAPPLVNQLTGKQTIPNADSAEIVALKNFLKPVDEGGSLTKAQIDAAFGVYDTSPPYGPITRGVLSVEQGNLLIRVTRGEVPADALDRLLPGGGDLAISMEQFMALQKIFTIEQLLPLQMIFDARMKNRPVQGTVES